MFAVEVQNLRKEFFRRDATRTRLRKRRRRVAALEDVTFTIERGECVAILGQNGSGKSTLVRLLSTLLLPDGGSATIFGHDVVKESRAVQRLVNRVSVEASFFKKMSSEENLAYAARFYGIPPSATKTAIPELLERVGFPVGRRHEGMEHLSRGMQQKVALARALLTSPVLLLLDEPTTGLDPRSKLEVQDFIREVRALPTRRFSSAPTTWSRRRLSPSASGSSTTADCSAWSRPARSRSATASRPSRRRSSLRPAGRSGRSGTERGWLHEERRPGCQA